METRKFLVGSLSILSICATLGGAATLNGCATAAVGAAGAAGGIAYTDRGAKGEIKGNAFDVDNATKAAFKDLNIQFAGSEIKKSGSEREITGKKGDMDVTVKIDQQANKTSAVEVIAHESTFKWNKDYAKNVLSKIGTKF